MELVRRRLVPSRSAAREAVAAGRVRVLGEVAVRPAELVDDTVPLRVEPAATHYVSRGGPKLAAALDRFGIPVRGRVALDAGASTGGFTDCLLQRGAAGIVAVDVGRDQLHPSLRNLPAVTSLEGTDVRTLERQAGPFDLIVADLSFISLVGVVGHLAGLGHSATDYLLLVKPQFETGGGRVGKRGVLRDPAAHVAAIEQVVAAAAAAGLGTRGLMASPLTGGDGNREFLLWAQPGPVRLEPSSIEACVSGGSR